MTPGIEKQIEDICSSIASQPVDVAWVVHNLRHGQRRSRARGDGDEFEQHDIYDPLEHELRNIDSAASAKTGGDPWYVRVNQDTRRLDYQVLVDLSPSAQFGTTRVSKSFVSAHAAACLLHSAKETGDFVKFVGYTAEGVVVDRPLQRAGEALIPTLYEILQPRQQLQPHSLWGEFLRNLPLVGGFFRDSSNAPDTHGGGLVNALESLPSARTVVFVISDFLTLTAEEKEALSNSHHDIVCIAVQDLRERELPQGSGTAMLQDVESGEQVESWLSDASRQEYTRNFQAYQASLFQFFEQTQISWTTVSTEEGDEATLKLIELFASHR